MSSLSLSLLASRPVLSLRAAVHRLRLARAARDQRRGLARLDDATLRDIGLTRSEAMREARRPAWDVPSTWLR